MEERRGLRVQPLSIRTNQYHHGLYTSPDSPSSILPFLAGEQCDAVAYGISIPIDGGLSLGVIEELTDTERACVASINIGDSDLISLPLPAIGDLRSVER